MERILQIILYFSQECLFSIARYSLHPYILLVEVESRLHMIRHLSTLVTILATDSILDYFLETDNMLLSEEECVQFLLQFFNVSQ